MQQHGLRLCICCTKMESSVAVLAQGNGSEDTAWVGVGALVAELWILGRESILRYPHLLSLTL